jgi:hypothetical protein
MGGLLDFIGTPQGQGLLSAAFGGMAGARQGTPWNNAGRAGVSGLVGYNQALDQSGEIDQRKQRQQVFDLTIKQMQQQQTDAQLARDNQAAFRASIASPQQSMLDSALGDGQGPTMANAAKLAPVDPYNQKLWQAMSLDQIKPMEYLSAIKKDDTQTIIPEGGTLVGGRGSGYKVLASGSPKVPTLSDVGRLRSEMNGLPLGDPGRAVYEAAITKATTISPGTVINNIPRNELGLAPKDQFDMERKLAAEFTSRTELDAGIISTAQDIGNILRQGGALKDQAAIYTFAKALDPKGAVREADYAAIVKTAGGLDYVTALFNKAWTGEQLTPKQRTEMTNLTIAMAAVAQKRVEKARAHFTKNAKLYKLNSDNIFQGVGEPGGTEGWGIEPTPGRN